MKIDSDLYGFKINLIKLLIKISINIIDILIFVNKAEKFGI